MTAVNHTRWCPRCSDDDVLVEAREWACFSCGGDTVAGRAPRGPALTAACTRVWDWRRDDPEVIG